MAKKIKVVLKLQIKGGAATPAPPVGTALGPHGVNLQEFCTRFNEQTRSRAGEVVPVVMTIYEDRSFDFILKIAPMSELLKQTAKIQKGASKSLKEVAGTITKAQVREVAEKKLPDLNTTDVEAAMRTVEGTARQMGIKITK
jgi:large subunit ribosomal protein L11